MTDERRLVVPIGQFGGVVRPVGSDRVEYRVRLGDDLYAMDAGMGLLYIDAYGDLDALDKTPWTRSSVLDSALGRGKDDLFQELVGNGFVVEVDPEGDAAVDFARTHRMIPGAHGTGNRQDDVLQFTVGSPPHVAGFSWDVYRLWQRSSQERSLWDACCALAEPDEDFDTEADARSLLTTLLAGAHVLLALGYATFDVLRTGEPDDEPEPDVTVVDSPDPGELIFPVGHDLGPFFRTESEPLSYYQVYVGRTPYGLPTDDDYAVWKRAHGPVDRPPLTVADYGDNLINDGIPDALALSNRLGTNGLVWPVPYLSDGHDRAIKFMRAHRIVPLAVAYGNAGSDVPRDHYAFGRSGVASHHVHEIGYWLWLWGGRHDSLWQTCKAFARSDVGRKYGDGDPHECLAFVLLQTQELIQHTLAFLDAAWDRRGTPPPKA